jgi:hypothetical protein
VPVRYRSDNEGHDFLVERIEFSNPPTAEEKAALLAFGVQLDLKLTLPLAAVGETVRKTNRVASAKASKQRQTIAESRTRDLLKEAKKIQNRCPDLSLTAIARRLKPNSTLKAQTIARKLSSLKKPR